jgi:hypothetical protein
MKTPFISLIIIAILTLSSCNQNKKDQVEYIYSNEIAMVKCESPDSLLVNEAIYEFEKNLNDAYNKDGKNLARTYTTFINLIIQKRFEVNEFATPHSLEIAKALNKSNLFKNGTFDFNSELSDCLFNSIKNSSLKTSLNALKEANSLRDNVLLPTFQNEARNFYNDKCISTILALRYYYPLLINLEKEDLVKKLDATPQNSNINFNNTPNKNQTIKPQIKAEQPGHEGHNH